MGKDRYSRRGPQAWCMGLARGWHRPVATPPLGALHADQQRAAVRTVIVDSSISTPTHDNLDWEYPELHQTVSKFLKSVNSCLSVLGMSYHACLSYFRIDDENGGESGGNAIPVIPWGPRGPNGVLGASNSPFLTVDFWLLFTTLQKYPFIRQNLPPAGASIRLVNYLDIFSHLNKLPKAHTWARRWGIGYQHTEFHPVNYLLTELWDQKARSSTTQPALRYTFRSVLEKNNHSRWGELKCEKECTNESPQAA